MKIRIKVIAGIIAWATIGTIVLPPVFTACSSKKVKKDKVVEKASNEGFLKSDDLVAIKSSNGTISIKNEATGKTTIKDIELEWTSSSPNDSLSVYCSDNKRGYFNAYTGEIVIPAQYRRAWIFSEGLAAVQKNGMIGFIDHKGKTVIDFKFPFHGNPLTEFIFKDGMCIVADTLGKCGIIDRKGQWIIRPEYDDISAFREYAIVSKAGVRMQMAYDGNIINSFVLDDIRELTYEEEERNVNKDGDISYIAREMKTGFFSYKVGGRCGLMDSNCKRLTQPLYAKIIAVDKNMFRARLLDSYSEVILNAKGEVMK